VSELPSFADAAENASSPSKLLIEESSGGLSVTCVPLAGSAPCGPDLADTDAAYDDFFADVEGVLPRSFFDESTGQPADPKNFDFAPFLKTLSDLWNRSRDLRLLVMRARLHAMQRDLAGFSGVCLEIAAWLETYWDSLHPQPRNGDASVRVAVLDPLQQSTVLFPLQFAMLFEDARLGPVSYRAWRVANGEVNARAGEVKRDPAAIRDALTASETVNATRQQLESLSGALLKTDGLFLQRRASSGLGPLIDLVAKMREFVGQSLSVRRDDPNAQEVVGVGPTTDALAVSNARAGAPSSLEQSKSALAAVVKYFKCNEPSSPCLPLVVQAQMLIGKSFYEAISILIPSQVEKAVFLIGSGQFFELPVGKLPRTTEENRAIEGGQDLGSFNVQSRGEAIEALKGVQQFFMRSEPASPVPMLCERARALAELDFMSVLKEVLPKAALK
jgi:type VI secretion system protein ImpA